MIVYYIKYISSVKYNFINGGNNYIGQYKILHYGVPFVYGK
jgi:hypothetical protein